MSLETTPVCASCGRPLDAEVDVAEVGGLCEACRPSPPSDPVEELLQRGARGTTLLLVIVAGLFVFGRLWFYDAAHWAEFTRWLKLANFCGDYTVCTVADQPWRLLTAAFLHAGFLHLIFCVWWIWELGRAIEMRRRLRVPHALRHRQCRGLDGGGLAHPHAGPRQCGWHRHGGGSTFGRASDALRAPGEVPVVPAYGIGLSPVVFALASFLVVTRRKDPVARLVLGRRSVRILIAWLLLGIVFSQVGAFPVSNWSHAAGAVWGLLGSPAPARPAVSGSPSWGW